MKGNKHTHTHTHTRARARTSANSNFLPLNWEYYSFCDKLTRHVALTMKIKRNWLAGKCTTQKPNFKFVSVSELHESKLNILRFCQNESFLKEILRLQKGNLVLKNSTILSLDPPFTDKLFRVRERLNSTKLSLKCQSQIIIDKNHQ